MQLVNDPSRSALNVRSIICDNNGIIIAETVYRCMFCAKIFDTMDQIQLHYHCEHYEEEISFKKIGHQKKQRKRPIIDYDQDDFDDPIEKVFDDDDAIVDQVSNSVEDYFEDNSHLMSMQLHENLDVDESK